MRRIREHRQPQADPQGEEGRPRPARAAQVPREEAQGAGRRPPPSRLRAPRPPSMRRRPVRALVPQAGEGRIDAEPPRSEEGRPQGPRPRPVHRRGHGQRAPRDPRPALSEARTGVSRPGEVRGREGGGVG